MEMPIAPGHFWAPRGLEGRAGDGTSFNRRCFLAARDVKSHLGDGRVHHQRVPASPALAKIARARDARGAEFDQRPHPRGQAGTRAMDASITRNERKAMATTQQQLDAVLQHISMVPDLLPALRFPRTPRDRERLVRKATLPPQLLHAAVTAVDKPSISGCSRR